MIRLSLWFSLHRKHIFINVDMFFLYVYVHVSYAHLGGTMSTSGPRVGTSVRLILSRRRR